MKQSLRIARTELQLLFYSPIAWLILIVFTIQASIVFTSALEGLVNVKELGYHLNGVTLELFTDPWRGFYTKLLGYLYFYIPLLTMGMMSREISSGSIKLLYASPVSDTIIVVGKFLSIVLFALIMTAIVLLFTVYGALIVSEFDFKATLPGLFGIFLLICAYGAVGLFMSSQTSYQVVAAIGTFAIFAILNYTSQMWQDIPFVRDIMYWLSIGGRTQEFIGGIISTEDCIYFLTVITLFLALTILRFNAQRQKLRKSVVFSRYCLALVAAMIIGYISSRPACMFYYDSTRTKLRTLTKASQEIVEKVAGDLTITTYHNALDEDRLLWVGMPRAELDDIRRHKEYLRFKPDIKMKYERYYAKGGNEQSLQQRFPQLNDQERMGKVAQSYGVDSTLFVPVHNLGNKQPILAAENHRYIKLLESENGQKAVLRMFNDPMLFPSEAEISTAFKRLSTPLPRVGFVEGHGERDCIKEGDRDYNKFAQERAFRYSLINQGFDFEQVNLSGPVPDSITILVIADMKTALSETEMIHYQDFIEKGGNIFIAGEPKRQTNMNPVTAPFGVQLLEGRLVKPQKEHPADLIFSKATEAAGTISYHFNSISKNNRVVTMPSVVALQYQGAAAMGFSITPILQADSAGVWNELETTDFVDDTVRLNSAVGEAFQPNITTGIALARQHNGKEQKIVILGDADCISNGELSRSRKEVPAANYGVIVGSFHWLSDGVAPIDVRRPPFTDNDIRIGKQGFKITKIAFTGVLPAIMLMLYGIVWMRRRRR